MRAAEHRADRQGSGAEDRSDRAREGRYRRSPRRRHGVRVLDRLRGTFAFTGPHVVAEGYEVAQRAGVRFARRPADHARRGARRRLRRHLHVARVHRDARAGPPRCRSISRARRTSLDLRRLPPPLQLPLATTLSVADYHVTGQGPSHQRHRHAERVGRRRGDARRGHGRRVQADARRGVVRRARHGRQPRPRSDRRRVRDRRARQARVRQPHQRDVRRHRQRAA